MIEILTSLRLMVQFGWFRQPLFHHGLKTRKYRFELIFELMKIAFHPIQFPIDQPDLIGMLIQLLLNPLDILIENLDLSSSPCLNNHGSYKSLIPNEMIPLLSHSRTLEYSHKSHNQGTNSTIQSDRIDPLAFMNKTY